MQNTRKVTDDIVWVGCNDRRLTLFFRFREEFPIILILSWMKKLHY